MKNTMHLPISTPSPLASPMLKISNPQKRVERSADEGSMVDSTAKSRAAATGSRASSILSDLPHNDASAPEPMLSAKRLHDKNASKARCNKKLKVPSPSDEDAKVGFHIKWHDIPIFVSLKKDGRLCYRAYKNESLDWTEQNWTKTFRCRIPLIHAMDIALAPDVCACYEEGDLQTAHISVKRKVIKMYLFKKIVELSVAAPVDDPVIEAEVAENIHIGAQINLDIESLVASGDLCVGTHNRHEVPVYAYLKRNGNSDFVHFRVHAREILPLELPSLRVQAGEIKFNESYDLGSIKATKAQILALLNPSRLPQKGMSPILFAGGPLLMIFKASETNQAVGVTTQALQPLAVARRSEDDSLTEVTKAAESAVGKLQAALAKRQQDIDSRKNKITSDKAQVMAYEDLLKKRERDFKAKEDAFEAKKELLQQQKDELKKAQLKLKHDENLFEEKQKATPPAAVTLAKRDSLKKWEAKLNQRELDVKHQEEHWVKDKEASFKAREQELEAANADLQRREDELQELQENAAVSVTFALNPGDPHSAITSPFLNAPTKKLMILDVPQHLAFDHVFKKVTSGKPNGGMLWEKGRRSVTITDGPFKGTSFTESRMLSEVVPIVVDGTLKPGKLIQSGESFSVHEKDGVRKLVQDLDRDSLVEYQGKYYASCKLLKEIVQDEAF